MTIFCSILAKSIIWSFKKYKSFPLLHFSFSKLFSSSLIYEWTSKASLSSSCSNSASFDIRDPQQPAFAYLNVCWKSLSLKPDPSLFSWGHLQLFTLLGHCYFVVRTYHIYLWGMFEPVSYFCSQCYGQSLHQYSLLILTDFYVSGYSHL